LLENPKQKDHLEDQGIEGWMTLKLILKEQDGRRGLDWSGSGQRHMAGYWKYGEPLGLVKCGEFVS